MTPICSPRSSSTAPASRSTVRWTSSTHSTATSTFPATLATAATAARDFAAPGGTDIHAMADGVVTNATYHYSYGYYVMIYHGTADDGNSYATLYAHMNSQPLVSVGQTVSKGQLIGHVGVYGQLHRQPPASGNGAQRHACQRVALHFLLIPTCWERKERLALI